MARLKRIFIPDVPQHIVVRGNNKQDIFFEEADRYYFLGCLQQVAQANDVAVHAYVLMTNHVHLLATGTARDSIPRMVQCLGRRYVAHVNRLYRRTGTLWEGRYRSAIVQTKRYLENCQRYIELNPVRAGLVADAAAYRWSSHRRMALGLRDDLVTPHRRFDGVSAADYRALFGAPLEDWMMDQIRDATQHGWGIGDEEFLEWASEVGGRRARRTRAKPLAASRSQPDPEAGHSDPEAEHSDPEAGHCVPIAQHSDAERPAA